MNRPSYILALLLAAAPLAHAQVVPVTTATDAARAHFEQGRARMAHADFVAARTHLDAALAADPAFGLAHLYRAITTPEGRDEHMRQAAAARVSDGERQLIDSYAAHLRGDHDAELALLNTVAEAFPGDPYPPFQLGAEYLSLDRYDEATAAFRRTSAADPTFAGAYNLLGYTAMGQDDDAAAERAFREYMRLAPEEANPYDSFGEYLMLEGRYDEAAAQFELALARDPEFTVSRDNLVRIAVLRMVDAYERAMQAGDPAAITALHAANAVILPGDEAAVRGREALTAYFAEEHAGPANVALESTGIVVAPSGDMAFDIGTTTWPGGTGKYLTVYRRIGGEWRIVADTWNRDAPAPTAAVAGSD
jgi:Tfp pilus assembly protein PilF